MPVSILRVAACCTVLRSRWYQSGISSTCSPEFATSIKGVSRLPLPPPVRRRQPHLASSPGPCATPPPMLPLPWLSAQRKCGCQLRRGSRCPSECPLLRARPVLLPTAVPPAPLLPVLQLRRQTPPRHSARYGSVRCPMRV